MAENTTLQETKIIEKPKPNVKKKKRNLNISGIVGAVILVVLLGIIVVFVKSFLSNSKGPVLGNRFSNALSEKITSNQLTTLRNNLKVAGVDKIEVNLIAATLRVSVDTVDNADAKKIEAIVDEIKKKLYATLPKEKYFTNQKEVKMYDYEIHVYNVVKSTDAQKQVYVVFGKSGAGDEYLEKVSDPKNANVAKAVKEVKKLP